MNLLLVIFVFTFNFIGIIRKTSGNRICRSIDTDASSNITLYLYTLQNPTSPQILNLNATQVINSTYFNPNRTNIFIIHGWEANYTSGVNTLVKGAYLNVSDVNVFVVDWSTVADKNYFLAFAGVTTVGRLLGNMIGKLKKELNLKPSSFILIGHSLGAHVAGCAGETLGGNISIIVGLDPAGPLYLQEITSNRLDPTDASFVHVIHTNGGVLGYFYDAGTVDIRPNGGSSQPGCELKDLYEPCSHEKSFRYFAESVASGGFLSTACDSYRTFTLGGCSSNKTTFLGGKNIDTSAKGDYYLETNADYPYSLS